MIRIKQYTAQLFLVATLLTGCVASYISTPTPVEGNSFTNTFLRLDAMPAQLAEILTLDPTWSSGPVWAVQYLMKTNHVFGVYGEDGRVVRWSLDSENIVVTHELGIAGPKALQFSGDGSILIGPTRRISRVNEYTNRLTDYMTGIAAWDMETGKLLLCLSFPCDGSTPEFAGGDINALIDVQGKQVFIYDETSIRITDLSGNSPSQVILINSPDMDYWWNIGNIAYDHVNQRYAIIYQEGLLEIDHLTPNKIGPFGFSTGLTEGTEGEFADIPAAMFDPSGNWLAYIRADQLIIWRFDQNSRQPFFEAEIHDAHSLLFDQTGKLLIVALKDKIRILDVVEKNVVAEYSTPGITSFSISGDNRLLIWGDEHGAIHIWGISRSG